LTFELRKIEISTLKDSSFEASLLKYNFICLVKVLILITSKFRIFEVIKINSPKHIKLKEFKNLTTSIRKLSEICYIYITADIVCI